MSLVKPYISKLNKINRSLSKIARQIIVENKQQIIDLIKYGQWEQGVDAMGKVVGRYSRHTQGYANADNISTAKAFGEPYNFKWSGQAISNLRLGKFDKDSYDITTIASKKRLFEEQGWDILKLTKEHNDYINEQIIEPRLYKYIIENMFQL